MTNYTVGMANAIKGMEAELIELRATCKQQDEELERYRTKEALETLSGNKLVDMRLHPIENAPGSLSEGEVVLVFWLEGLDRRYGFDFLEDGVWKNHSNDYEHYIVVGGPSLGPGPTERAPYTHYAKLPTPAAEIQTGTLDELMGEEE